MNMVHFLKELLLQFSPFSPYQIKRIHSSHLISQKKFDVGLQDYYHYLLKLFAQVLAEQPTCQVNLAFEVSDFPALFKGAKVQHLSLQIEHTLVKPGGRGSELAKPGVIPIPGDLMGRTYLVRLAHIEKLEAADLIIEYSRSNIQNIKTSKQFPAILKKMVQIAPTLYPLVTVNPITSIRSIECATLFRNMNEPRRKLFFEGLLAQKIPVQNVNNVFNHIENTYAQIKVLINIRQTDHHDTLEELRVLPALRCGVIVISEAVPLMRECRYSDFIIWGKLEELPALTQAVLANYDSYYQKIFQSKHFARRMQRLELANYLKVQRVINNSMLQS
jgi:hypothetical protein